jgi:hypothetical protein
MTATPAPHVPVAFLNKGGLSFFSDNCIEQLAKYGYEPEDFGSYDHVAERLRSAREKCADPDAGKPGHPPAPTDRERELGKPMGDKDHYESGHLGMNTCMQGKRGDPCSNFVSGHDDGLYPCMPHQGSATDPGSEHNVWTAAELDVTSQAGKNPRDTYPAGKMSDDADARTKALLDKRPEIPQPTGNESTTGGGPPKPATGAVDPQAKAEAAKARANEKGRMPEDERVDGETAEDCINNFRKMGEAGMKKHISDQATIDKNRGIAGTAKQREDAEKDAAAKKAVADDAREKLQGPKDSLRSQKGALTKAQNAGQGVPTEEQAAKIDAAQAKVDAKEKEVADLQAKYDAAAEEASTAKGVATRRRNADCRANQGEAIQTGQPFPAPPKEKVHPSDDGKYPKPWDNFAKDGTQQGTGTAQEE